VKRLTLFLTISSLCICAFAQAGSTNSQNTAPANSGDRINASAVWQPSQDFITKAQTTCTKGAGPASFEACFMNQIAAAAPPAAVSFTRMLYKQNGQIGIMTAFKNYGVVDAAQVLYPLRANDNYALLLVNGDPNFLDVDDLKMLDRSAMEQSTMFQTIKQAFPQADLWPGDRSGSTPWPQMKTLPDGGMQFIVHYQLLNGCHACRHVGLARYAWQFDSKGKFLSAKFVSGPVPPIKLGPEPQQPAPAPAPESSHS